MIAKIQLPDGMPLEKVIKGSIYLTANAEGSFRMYNISDNKGAKRCFKRLSHGRISWTKDNVRLNIHIDRSEVNVNPNYVICKDAADAAEVDFEN